MDKGDKKNNDPLRGNEQREQGRRTRFWSPSIGLNPFAWLLDGPDNRPAEQKKGTHSLWVKVRPRHVKSNRTKRQQAITVQACLESGHLFDAHTRPWKTVEVKKMQFMIERVYRYLWGNEK